MSHSILIVDDKDDEARMVADVISALVPATIDFASDRHEAWAKVQGNKYQAIVLDLDLKGLHEGPLFLETLRGHLTNPPGTVIVSHAGNQPAARELKIKFDFVTEVVSKRDILALTDTLRRALQAALGDEPPAPPIESVRIPDEPSRARRIAIIVAIIGAVATIFATLIKVVGDFLLHK